MVDEDRGVSAVIGFILIFALIVISWTTYQGFVVPQQEQGIEFDHNQEVQNQLQSVRDAIQRVSVTGSHESVRVQLGAEYPQRHIASTLATSSGTIETIAVGDGRFAIENASALNSETSDFWNGTVRRYDNKILVYEPGYVRYSNAPATVYDQSVLYNQFRNNRNLTVTDQSIIDGRRVSLVAVNGSFARTGQGSASVNIDAKSTSSSRIGVSSGDDDPINITLSTRLSEDDWSEILEDEMTPAGHVESVAETGENQVSILLEPGVTYDLRLSKIGIGTEATSEEAEYVTAVRMLDSTVLNGTTHRVVVETRDRFNNPISGFDVNASASAVSGSDEGAFTSEQVTTDSDGQAEFEYTAPNESGEVELEFSIYDGSNEKERVVSTHDVKDLGGGGSSIEELNPGGGGSIMLTDQMVVGGSVGGGSGETDVWFSLRNSLDEDVNIEAARISFFFSGGTGDTPTKADMSAPNADPSVETQTELQFNDNFNPLEEEIRLPGNETETEVRLEFDENIGSNDFYVISLRFSNDATSTYFVSHP